MIDKQKHKLERKNTRKMVMEFRKKLLATPVDPESLTDIKLYQVLQELHFQGRYDLVRKICKALIDE